MQKTHLQEQKKKEKYQKEVHVNNDFKNPSRNIYNKINVNLKINDFCMIQYLQNIYKKKYK